MRVLIVDDEESFSRPLAQRLGLRGMVAGTAPDAPSALAALDREPADLVFLDVGLPGMDGVELLKALRVKHPQTDVVMLSGSADMGKAVQAMRRGAFNWLSKPVDMEDVLAECRKAGERAEARREAARLAEAERWRHLGQVAEGVAHEVNNPLNIMVQAAGLVRDCLDVPEAEALPDLDDVRNAVETIQTQSLRVREITRKLLMVGHGLDARTGPLDVEEEVDLVLETLRPRMLEANVRCETQWTYAAQNPHIGEQKRDTARPLGSGPEFRQICLHLLENALDAMPGGGLVRIWSRLRSEGQGRDWYDFYVEDSGPGISPDVMPHIFEPVFSTRALQNPAGNDRPQGRRMGRYAGLGLAVARSLAHARGGELTAENSHCGGALFCLSLPLAEEAATPSSM